jgi:hypothetical protein
MLPTVRSKVRPATNCERVRSWRRDASALCQEGRSETVTAMDFRGRGRVVGLGQRHGIVRLVAENDRSRSDFGKLNVEGGAFFREADYLISCAQSVLDRGQRVDGDSETCARRSMVDQERPFRVCGEAEEYATAPHGGGPE